MYIFARWLSARNCIRPRTPTLPNQNATWRSCIIHAAITRKRLSFIALRLRLGRRRMKSPRRIMRLWCRITPTFCVLLARYAKRTNWKFVHARGARANLTRNRLPPSYHRIEITGSILQPAGRLRIVVPLSFARVAELADAYGSGPYGETRGGSSPLASTKPRPPNRPSARGKTENVQCQLDGLITSLRLSFLPPSEPSLTGRAFFARLA